MLSNTTIMTHAPTHKYAKGKIAHRHAHTSTCPFSIFRFLVCRPFTQRVTVVLLRVYMHRCLHVPDQISRFPLGRRKACVVRPISLCHRKPYFRMHYISRACVNQPQKMWKPKCTTHGVRILPVSLLSCYFFFFFCQYIFYKDGQIANRS